MLFFLSLDKFNDKMAIHELDVVDESEKDVYLNDNTLFEHDSNSSFQVYTNPLFESLEHVSAMIDIDDVLVSKNMHVKEKRKGGLSISIPLDFTMSSLVLECLHSWSMTSISYSLMTWRTILCMLCVVDAPHYHPTLGDRKLALDQCHAFFEYKFLVDCSYSLKYVMNIYRLLFIQVMHIGVIMLGILIIPCCIWIVLI